MTKVLSVIKKPQDDGQIMPGIQITEELKNGLGQTAEATIHLETAINLVFSIIEFRDPYTAEHQREVADLACQIAETLGMPPARIIGLRMACLLHDIGKISVPAEILCKPRKLTKEESDLMQMHSISGYKILQNIPTTRPLALIVLQHHERLDGSGYPNGISGNEILLESRILAVADVVNSMSSHRPYRPSLGIEAAIAEIKKNREILYDGNVVDACINTLRKAYFAACNN